MNSYITKLENDESLKEVENYIAPEDTVTFSVYCHICRKKHFVGAIVGRRMNKTNLGISLFMEIKPSCPNMLEEKDRNPINLNFL